jgi:hypothetical protein
MIALMGALVALQQMQSGEIHSLASVLLGMPQFATTGGTGQQAGNRAGV